MKRYKITLLIPHETTIEAPDMKFAHEEGKRLAHVGETADGVTKAILHSVVELGEVEPVDFDDPFPPMVA